MKKLLPVKLLIISFIFITSFTAQAQVRFGVGLDPAVPVANMPSAFGIGGGLGFHIQAADNFALGANASFLYFLKSNEVGAVSTPILPLQLDGRYYIGDGDVEYGGFYVNTSMGVHYYLSTDNVAAGADFSWAPIGVGYQFEEGLHLSARYQLIFSPGANPQYIAMRLGYDF